MNQREFDRFSIDLALEVSATDSLGEKYNEKTELVQISGGGARFITRQADRYFIGQIVDVTIDMPGTTEVKATMKGTATVLRIEPSSPSDNGEEDQTVIVIAIKFNTRLQFTRD